MHAATLHLFNAVYVTDYNTSGIPQDVSEHTIRQGYVMDPRITPNRKLLAIMDRVVGLSGEKANAAFHKSWATVAHNDRETLVAQQLLHYLTTYGYKELGIYDKDTVYIPAEKLELPSIADDIPLTMVRAIDTDELIERIVQLGQGIALAESTLDSIVLIIKEAALPASLVDRVGNRELLARLYEHFGMVPSDPVEFLRYVLVRVADRSLLIKNQATIDALAGAPQKELDSLLEKAPENLASVFYRFKPLFLAMKKASNNKAFFNRLRKDAVKQHAPLAEDALNAVTRQIKRGTLDLDRLTQRLETASVFRKIRLAYALKARMKAGDSIVYKVRNGRGWATDFDWPDALQEATQAAYNCVMGSLCKALAPKLAGKTVFIPEELRYALPASEKMFTGHFPTGSSVAAPHNLIVGIHWENTTRQIDLDLSAVGETKIGWDGQYRTDDGEVLFSGDVVDAPAPLGASELFHFRGQKPREALLLVNYYNYEAGDPVAANLLIANERPESFGHNYMVNVNNLMAKANLTIEHKQTVIGLVATRKGKARIYFAHTAVGNNVTSRVSKVSMQARDYLVNSLVDSIDLREVLKGAGAQVRNRRDGDEDFDLAADKLTKSTFLELLQA